MEDKKGIKISLSTFLLIIALIVIIIISYFMYKLYNEKNIQTQEVSNLNSQISNLENSLNKLQSDVDEKSENNNKTKDEDTEETKNNENTQKEEVEEVSEDKNSEKEEVKQEKVEIPEADNNLSDEEEDLINGYLRNVWITSDGKDILVIDYGKRFCYINVDDNSREYGTYTVKTGDEPTITLNYTSGKNETLTYTQGSSNYLMGENESYIEYEGYFFGASDGDEGIFNK